MVKKERNEPKMIPIERCRIEGGKELFKCAFF